MGLRILAPTDRDQATVATIGRIGAQPIREITAAAIGVEADVHSAGIATCFGDRVDRVRPSYLRHRIAGDR